MQTMPTAHMHLDDRGVAWIDDTNVKVVEVVLDKRVWLESGRKLRTAPRFVSSPDSCSIVLLLR